MVQDFFTASKLPINHLTLSFQPAVEKEYQEDYYRKSLTHIRVVILLAIFNYLVFGVLDNLLAPAEKHELWFIRYAVFTPFALAVFLFSFAKNFMKYVQLSLVSVVLVAGFGIINMILIVPPPNNYAYYAGLILVFFYLFTFMKAQFIWAALAGFILIAAYEIVAILCIKAPFNILINNNFFFITSYVVGMCACYSIDLTSRKNFAQAKLLEIEKEKVRKANEDLEKKVKERTKNLSISNKALQKEIAERIRLEKERKEMEVKAITQSKLASLGTISTGIAHEINQPLTYIKIIFESIMKDLEKNQLSHDELADDSHESLKQINRISTIINHLRTFGRDDALKFENTDLEEVLNNALILFSQRLKLRNIIFKTDIQPDLPSIYGNNIKLEQVFINLLQNSIDAVDVDGRQKKEILVSMAVEGDSILIKFSDNGSGISDDFVDKIFEPFYTSKDVGKGTGLGLSIVYGILQEHHGEIKVASKVGEGTTFTIKIPQAFRNSEETL